MRILVFVSATLNAAVERGTKPDMLGRQPGSALHVCAVKTVRWNG